jgi:hypothetical protein
VQTDELTTLAMDLRERVSKLPWVTGALFIAGMYPSPDSGDRPGVRRVDQHLLLMGPVTDQPPPVPPIAKSRHAGQDWIRVAPYPWGLVDLDMFHDALTTRPVPGSGKELNIMVVYYMSRDGSVRAFMAHHEEMDQSGAGEKLMDDEWVYNTFSLWLDAAATRPDG